MNRAQSIRAVAPMAMLVLSQPVAGQNSLDLEEADARNDAYEIISAAEEQFDCKLEERAMQSIGNEPDIRYVFHVKAEGAGCRAALVFASNAAAREDKIMFRQVTVADKRQRDAAAPGIRQSPVGPLLIQGEQVLIHEVNPDMDGTAPAGE